MPTTSKRLAILTELRTRIGAIAVENGFSTDAGALIFFGETPMLGDDDPPAALAFIVRDDQPTDQMGTDVLVVLPVEIQALAKADSENPWLTVEKVIADIKFAIENGDRSLGGVLTRGLARGKTRALPREPGATTIGAGVGYSATYLEAWASC